jgi:hypothetical protein
MFINCGVLSHFHIAGHYWYDHNMLKSVFPLQNRTYSKELFFSFSLSRIIPLVASPVSKSFNVLVYNFTVKIAKLRFGKNSRTTRSLSFTIDPSICCTNVFKTLSFAQEVFSRLV